MLKRIRKTIRKVLKIFKKIHYKFNVLLLIFVFLCSLTFPQHAFAQASSNQNPEMKLQGAIVRDALLPVLNSDINKLSLKQNRLPEIKDRELTIFTYHYVTAYNVGVVAQTDNTPCIGASGDNLCELVDQGIKVCAANFVPLGTNLEIEGLGTCKVLDRMHARHSFRVDIAMGPDEIDQAQQFGLRQKKVAVY